jgi:hypothetical protein
LAALTPAARLRCTNASASTPGNEGAGLDGKAETGQRRAGMASSLITHIALITHIELSFAHFYALIRINTHVTQSYAMLRRFTQVYTILRMLRMLRMITLIYACYTINTQ